MFENKAVQENIRMLKTRGIEIIEPMEGSLACKDTGKGKLPSVDAIYKSCVSN
jgi:phosphopantothenoylcysteine decarboxylase/phosphopantothenate--cysteine ligase